MAMNKPEYIDRPPRIQPELPSGKVEIPSPPRDERTTPLWQVAVPVVTIIGYLLVSAFGSSANVAFLLPMLLTVVISTGIAISNTIRDTRERRQARIDYQRALKDLRHEMVLSHNRQRSFYAYNYPPIPTIMEMKGDRSDNRSGTRIWERRPHDSDFGMIRLGIGTRRSTVDYVLKAEGEGVGSPLFKEAERLKKDSEFVSDVPIGLSLYRRAGDKVESGQPSSVHHLVGISGTPSDIYEFIQALLVQFAAFHSANDATLGVVGVKSSASHWTWAYALPHVQINPGKGYTRLYFEDMELIITAEKGKVTEWLVKEEEHVSSGHLLARFMPTNSKKPINICAPFSGVVQKILVKEGEVEDGTLLARIDSYKLTDQQLEDLGKNSLRDNLGKQRKREMAGVPRFWREQVWSDLDRRSRRLRDRGENDSFDVTLPFMLTVVDLLGGEMSKSWLDDLESEAAHSLLIGQGQQLGGAIIFLAPSRGKIPSACQVVIELTRDANNALKFLYAETGATSGSDGRYVGQADKVVVQSSTANQQQYSKAANDAVKNGKQTEESKAPIENFAAELAKWKVRRPYGADIPSRVALLDLFDKTPNAAAVRLETMWADSFNPKKADWPQMPVGMMAGSEPRELHFFADADGVHGMIAGATGSGKSELLMTIILSLAMKYDPRIVNFVLIDFKGGGAFEPFRTLPHVVEVLTNLGGTEVDRMFASIRAELERRQRINQDTDVKDIVGYRERNYHHTRQDNYPHLFIIIDEFAEMIALNAEYKQQLDSITRLGRALGVSLLLAAQRPTGVTDQMRANIKMKLCLRVETKDESNEMLRLPDASYLPSIPGRGYLQIGSESLQLIQVGYTGQPYTQASFKDETYDPLERYDERPFIWKSQLDDQEPEKLYEVLVRRIRKEAEQVHGRDRVVWPWRKPWPAKLPTRLTLNTAEGIEVRYIEEDDRDEIDARDEAFSLAPAVQPWLESESHTWKTFDWSKRPLKAVIGLLDDPSNAQLRTLQIDLTRGHYAIFGAANYGKSWMLRSMITALVASHSPADLHLYILDFGSQSLALFKGLKHVGAYILSRENERVARLFRKLDALVAERKKKIGGAMTYLQYNQSRLHEQLPSVVVIIDNMAEFRSSFELQYDQLAALLREGTSVGLYFVVTGELTNAVGKHLSLIPERLTLRLSDENDYATIIGRGARPPEPIPGRGLQRMGRNVLDFQTAIPIGVSTGDVEDQTDATTLDTFVNRITTAGKHAKFAEMLPEAIQELETLIGLDTLIEDFRSVQPFGFKAPQPVIVLGRNDLDLSAYTVTLTGRTAHMIVTGPPASGRTTTLQTMIMALAKNYTPQEIGIILVDDQLLLNEHGGQVMLHEMPHVYGQETLISGADLVRLEKYLRAIYTSSDDMSREIFVFFDSYENMERIAKEFPEVLDKLGNLATTYRKQGLHFIIAGTKEAMKQQDTLFKQASANRFGLALDIDSAESSPFYAFNIPRAYRNIELPRGRGFIVRPGKIDVVQVAVPMIDAEEDGDNEELMRFKRLDNEILRLKNQYTQRREWPSIAEEAEPPKVQPLTDAQKDCIITKLAQQMYPNITDLEPYKSTVAVTMQDDEQTFRDLIASRTDVNLAECLDEGQI